MKTLVGIRVNISSFTKIELLSGDDIPSEIENDIPNIFKTQSGGTVVGTVKVTNDIEIAFSAIGSVILKKGDVIPDAILDKVPDAFKTTGVIPPSPSVEKNAEDIAKNKIAIDTNKTDIAELDINATKMTTTATATAGVDGEEHWVSVAISDAGIGFGRRQSRVMVSDKSDFRHSFIEIDWIRSYSDNSFNVLNKGGSGKCFTGVRILTESSSLIYGKNILQIRVDKSAEFTVSIISDYANPGWQSPVAVAPVVEDTKAGFQLYGRELTGIKYLGFGTSKGVKFGGDVYTDGHFYDNGKLVGLDKAKAYIDMDPEDFPGDRNTYGLVGLSAIKYQTPGNNFTLDVNTNEVVINREGYYNIKVVLNHTKGASTSTFSNARVYKNGTIALGAGSAGNTDAWFSLVVKALGEHLVAGDRICVKSNGRNDNSHWSTFSIEEI